MRCFWDARREKVFPDAVVALVRRVQQNSEREKQNRQYPHPHRGLVRPTSANDKAQRAAIVTPKSHSLVFTSNIECESTLLNSAVTTSPSLQWQLRAEKRSQF